MKLAPKCPSVSYTLRNSLGSVKVQLRFPASKSSLTCCQSNFLSFLGRRESVYPRRHFIAVLRYIVLPSTLSITHQSNMTDSCWRNSTKHQQLRMGKHKTLPTGNYNGPTFSNWHASMWHSLPFDISLWPKPRAAHNPKCLSVCGLCKIVSHSTLSPSKQAIICKCNQSNLSMVRVWSMVNK